MAATIALAFGRGKGSESKASRLGHESSEAQANTYKTFTTAIVNKDGSGSVQVARDIDGRRIVIHRAEFGPEEQKGGNPAWVNILPWGSGAEVSNAEVPAASAAT